MASRERIQALVGGLAPMCRTLHHSACSFFRSRTRTIGSWELLRHAAGASDASLDFFLLVLKPADLLPGSRVTQGIGVP